ncbi:TPA: DoxX family protein [Candidatus Woesearchaeota archaeon]|nr:DoxX family protein [Candidatus Woesearchaeota archaeon]HII68400.1 DoxX family protein [Candidatus Woesearchaeota archaeon]
MIEKVIGKNRDWLYAVFRIAAGFLFFSHGAQKLLGWFGGTAMWGNGQMVTAGLIEFIGGLLILAGLFSRLAALASFLLMIAAYFIAHAGNGIWPIVNKGELAILYAAAFLVVLVYGNGKASVEKALLKKEHF